MPDEQNYPDSNNFDIEAPTGESLRPTADRATEHADLKHRIEVDAADERAAEAASQDIQAAAQPNASMPAATPVQANSLSTEQRELRHPGPGILVLQWLTYAFWGWTVLALSGLVALVVDQLISSDDADYSMWDMNSGIAYLLAAVIVLYIISIVTDVFYAKLERTHARSSGTNVIMIIHAVIFALCGIGALISSVFGGVSLLIGGENSSSDGVATIIIGAIIFIIYGMTLLRTLRPKFIKGVAGIYWLFMTVAVIVTVAGGVFGPAAQERLRSADRVIEEGLPSVAQAINTYTTENGKLPATLSDIPLSSLDESGQDRAALLKSITYKPGEKIESQDRADRIFGGAMSDQMGGAGPIIYHYELCVVYKKARGGSSNSYGYPSNNDRYDTYIDTYEHPAGLKCYDVQTDYSY